MTEEIAQLLRDWLAYWNVNGHSTGLRERTESILARHSFWERDHQWGPMVNYYVTCVRCGRSQYAALPTPIGGCTGEVRYVPNAEESERMVNNGE